MNLYTERELYKADPGPLRIVKYRGEIAAAVSAAIHIEK